MDCMTGKTKFLVSIEGSDKPDEIVDYNVVLDYVNAQMDDNLDPSEVIWKFKKHCWTPRSTTIKSC